MIGEKSKIEKTFNFIEFCLLVFDVLLNNVLNDTSEFYEMFDPKQK
jgi:hypothetical protein